MSSVVDRIKKPVNIQFCQTFSASKSKPIIIEERFKGSLYRVAEDIFILSYDSIINGTSITNTLKLQGSVLSLVTIGDVHSRQSFCINQHMTSEFYCASKQLVLSNHTKTLNFSLNENGGLIDLLYQLGAEENHLGFYGLEWHIFSTKESEGKQ